MLRFSDPDRRKTGFRASVRLRAGASAWLVLSWVAGAACTKPESAQWLLNGFLDPTQVGQFRESRRNEIRSVLSILEEPTDVQNSEEPQSGDLIPTYNDTKIAPGDAVTITVLELLAPGEATTQQIRVGASGYETLPVIGRIKMAGFTARELELHLKELLRETQVLENAEVQVTLVESRGAQFSIIGSVQRPGTYALPMPDYRVLNAFAECGGIAPQVEKIYIFRRGEGSMEGPSDNLVPSGPLASEPAAFFLSDTSSSQATTSRTTSSWATTARTTTAASTSRAVSTTASATQPKEEPPIDELKILEGGPTETMPPTSWDPDRGWIIGTSESQPTTHGAAAPDSATTASSPSPDGETAQPLEELAPSLRIIEIPTKELLMGDARYNVVIRPYDLINVPPGNVGEFYLMGNVGRAGAYEITGRRLTVKEAIASAGGFGPLAWPSRADLVRRINRDEEQIIQLDLDAIFAGSAPDFYLKPNDIVNVGTTPQAVFLAVLRNAFRFSYGFGFVYDRNFADADAFQAKEQLKQRRFQEAVQRGLPPP